MSFILFGLSAALALLMTNLDNLALMVAADQLVRLQPEDRSNDCETDTIAADPHALRAGPGIGREGNIGTLGSR